MLKAGIIDPTKVTRIALENAASVAGMILTTECALVDIKEDAPACYASNGWWYARNDVKIYGLLIELVGSIIQIKAPVHLLRQAFFYSTSTI